MRQIQNSDQQAFNVLVNRHIDALFGFAIRLGADPSNAEDLVQETWLRVWTKSDTYQAGRVRPTTWVFRILHNLFIDSTRKQRPTSSLTEEHEQLEDTKDLEADSIQTQREAQLMQLVEQLNASQRAAILLFYRQGFSTAEIGNIIGVSTQASESLLARGRRQLRRLWKKQNSVSMEETT